MANKVKRILQEIKTLSTQELSQLIFLVEKYSKKSEVPDHLNNLTLSQANYWAKVYDGVLKDEDKKDKDAKAKAARIAWYQTKKKYPKLKK